MSFSPPKLKYKHNALEPYISEQVVKYHFDHHTLKYYDTVNKLIVDTAFNNIDTIENAIIYANKYGNNSKLLFNLGQAWNHSFYWDGLTPSKTKPSDDLNHEIESSFKTMESFTEELIDTGVSGVGSMWTWVLYTSSGLKIKNLPNGSTPLIGVYKDSTPLLTIDGWEHAYYLQYPADKKQYYEKIINVIDWDVINDRYTKRRKD